MKKLITGFTILESLIGITLLAVIMGSILGAFIVIQRYFKDGIALASSQAAARIVIEKIVRPEIREGSSFSITDGGDTLTVTKYDNSIDIFKFVDNRIKKNGNIIGTNIVSIPDKDIFENVAGNNKLVSINFGVMNKGEFGGNKEVHISTEMKLRN